ncbi:hypothetical protein A6770_05575 [Nostoc minutum NIES-26]|uniref:DUF1822 domain-containing protein n=1 Tax=Nostoc minutum NIES-26 TaxID=1844469 RepID=A0A367Q744_9NOSO|nr:hypothetical protein A6770_05575 [Nostoc minutum NIES-26]
MGNQTAFLTFSGIISPSARQLAEQLCRQQATPKKGEQVRLNTLAVSFVNSYLQYMSVETDLEASDCWNPVQQLFMDVADLSIKNIGSLECRPVLEGEEFVYVPPEAQSNRIGYVAVQISKSYREAKLLGFIKEVSTDILAISQLSSLEKLLEYLTQLNTAKLTVQSQISNSLIQITQWFDNIIDNSWQEIEALLSTQAIYADSSLRNTKHAFISRGKLIELRQQKTEQTVVLVVTLTPENESEMDVIVEIHPTKGEIYLPQNLQLKILDLEGACVMEAQTRSTNKNIQLQFSGEIGEHFSVKLVLGDSSTIESFAI